MTSIDSPEFRELLDEFQIYHINKIKLIAHIDAKIAEAVKEKSDIAVAALEAAVCTCFDQYAHHKVMSDPNHFVNVALDKLKGKP